MTKALNKNIRRCIRDSLGRYIAILLIITLGVAFLTGLRLTRPAMTAVATDYIGETGLFDLRLISTLGFDRQDVEAARGVNGVTAAQGSVFADFLCQRDGEMPVYRAHMLTEGINTPKLTAGRMPAAANECLADAKRFREDMIGQTIVLSDENSGDTLERFTYRKYTIVGLANSPLYLSVERGTTTLGNGSLTGFVLIPEAGFQFEYYTELFIRADNDFALYSEEYDALMESLSADMEQVVLSCVTGRYETLRSDAEAELLRAEQTFSQEEADARQELLSAWRALEDARLQLEEGEAELEDGWQQLCDAKVLLDEGAEQMLSGYPSWNAALKAGWNTYYDGVAQFESGIADAEKQLTNAKFQLETLEQTWKSGQAELDEGWAVYNDYLVQWQAGYDQYAAGKAEFDANYAKNQQAIAENEQALAALEANKDNVSTWEYWSRRARLEATRIALELVKAGLDAYRQELDSAKQQLDEQYEILLQQRAPLDEAQAQLDYLHTNLQQGWCDYNTGMVQLSATKKEKQAQLDDAKAKLEQFEAGILDYETGLADYEAGREKLEEGWTEYRSGLEDYRQGEQTLESRLTDARSELDRGWEDLKKLETPTLYVLDRNTNTGYVTFESDSQIVDKLASFFPVFFFLIAALVCSTTMQRMVDEERTQIGTMRALGYSRGSILSKYLIYASSAASIGCLLGYFGGGYLFPLVIWIAYQLLYNIPGYICVYDPLLFVVALAASLLCSAGTAYIACRREMADTPANLIRPKTPSAGKRILLERITPVWRRLKFLHKVTLRNIFRFKKRMFMMILGIAGCTALVLTGFGIRDSVANIANFQFDDIQKYDIAVNCDRAIDDQWLQQIEGKYGGQMQAHAAALLCSGELSGSDGTKSVNFVVSDDKNITDIIDLHLDGEAVAYPGTGEVVLSQKLADLAGVKVGDRVTLSLGDQQRGEVTVTVAGLAENYVLNYVYLTGQTYDRLFGQDASPTCLLLRLQEGADVYDVAASLAGEDHVTSVSVTNDTRKTIDNMMKSLNYVVALVLCCAGALAFIVLFNLGNINITERVREIATIKVLGFHGRETGAYVFRENIILSCMGIVFGLPLGVALHAFVMSQITVDMVSFKVIVKPVSFVLTVLMVLLFTVICDLVLRRKLHRIDMAQSLKSVE